jgi:S1-C subfamily serine protease
MSGSHRPRPQWSRMGLWLLSLVAALGLGLVTAPAQASPPRPLAPQDALAAVGQVGPTIVDIDTQMGYQSAVGAGTGIVIGPSTILTNNHVIAGATGLNVRSIGNGQSFPGTVIGFDRSHDIAVVQLGGGGLQPANIGNSDTIRVGDPIVSMGNAGGAGGAPSAVEGRVSSLNQTVSAHDSLTGSTETLNGLIQVDAGIRPGDSGGPTVNSANQVIGLNTAATENFHLGRGQGFAIPINEAMAIAGQIQGGGGSPTVHVGPTAFLGVGVNDAGR